MEGRGQVCGGEGVCTAPCPGDASWCQGWGARGEAGTGARAAPRDREGPPGAAARAATPKRCLRGTACPLTWHGVAEDVALGRLGPGLPGQPQEGRPGFGHVEMLHAATALWGQHGDKCEPRAASTYPRPPSPRVLTGARPRRHRLTDAVGILSGDSHQVLRPCAQPPQHSACLPRTHAHLGGSSVTPMPLGTRHPERVQGSAHLLPLGCQRLPQPRQWDTLHPIAGDGAAGRAPADAQHIGAVLQDLQVGGARVAWSICGGTWGCQLRGAWGEGIKAAPMSSFEGLLPGVRRVPPELVHTLRVISGTNVPSSLKSPT